MASNPTPAPPPLDAFTLKGPTMCETHKPGSGVIMADTVCAQACIDDPLCVAFSLSRADGPGMCQRFTTLNSPAQPSTTEDLTGRCYHHTIRAATAPLPTPSTVDCTADPTLAGCPEPPKTPNEWETMFSNLKKQFVEMPTSAQYATGIFAAVIVIMIFLLCLKVAGIIGSNNTSGNDEQQFIEIPNK